MLLSRKLVPQLLLCAFVAFMATEAGAYSADYVDLDPVGRWLNEGDTVSGTFDIILIEGDDFTDTCVGNCENMADVGGFDVLAEEVVGARITFLFLDWPDRAWETVVLELDGGAIDDIVLSQQVFFLSFAGVEAGVEVIASLNDNGQLDWSLSADSGAATGGNGGDSDLLVALARLEAVVSDKSTESGGTLTPEPGSAALLAVGALLVARAGRSRRRH